MFIFYFYIFVLQIYVLYYIFYFKFLIWWNGVRFAAVAQTRGKAADGVWAGPNGLYSPAARPKHVQWMPRQIEQTCSQLQQTSHQIAG